MKEKFEIASKKSKQGLAWENDLVKRLNAQFADVNVPYRAYTLLELHSMHPAFAYVADKRDVNYFSAVDSYMGDVFIFYEDVKAFERVAVSIACKSVNGDSFNRENDFFLAGPNAFCAIRALDFEDSEYTYEYIVPANQMLRAHEMTDATLGRALNKSKLDYVPLSNIVMLVGVMSVEGFARHIIKTRP